MRDAVEWGDELIATIGTSKQLDFFEEGRLVAVQVSSDTAAAWRLNGMQVLARKAGRW